MPTMKMLKVCFIVASVVPLVVANLHAQSIEPAAVNHREFKTKSVEKPGSTIPALLISDIHFEPFWDPAKVEELVAAPVNQWHAILSSPPSSDQQERFKSLQQSCHTRGADTSFTLLQSSLHAMQSGAGDAKFITVSGDLISHAFSCKFTALFPKSSPGDYRAFVVKTLDYILAELRATFPGTPVYSALGNNDSDCGDYKLDGQSAFLASLAGTVTEGFPASELKEAERTFASGGYYSVSPPAPILHTRLIVLEDLFMSRNYTTCAGKHDPSAAIAEIEWLKQQLLNARNNKEHIWVMGHIPPGIDPYSTALKMRNICAGQAPEMFLSSEALSDTLVDFSDVVQLAIFAHTHMDEMRLLRPDSNSIQQTSQKSIAVKMVPSISPIDGNNPSFTVVRLDPVSATLKDYKVIAASNQTGVEASWSEEYDFAHTFHQGEYSSATLHTLVDGFRADPGALTPASQGYIRDYFVGNRSLELTAFWPGYSCAISNHTAESYQKCVCADTSSTPR